LYVVAITDFDRAHAEQIDYFGGFDRIRQMPARARHGGFYVPADTPHEAAPGRGVFDVPAEPQHDAALPFRNDVETTRKPYDDHECREQTEAAHAPLRAARTARAAVTTAASAEKPFELAIEIAPQLLEIRRPLIAA